MKRQSGFTLIELVMVIVILGILSAFALPRFADLGADARGAAIEGVAGAIRSAASIAHAEALVSGVAAGDDVALEGQAITMVNFYPTANAAGVITAAQIDANDFDVSAGGAGAGSTITVRANGAPAAVAGPPATDCSVTYTSPGVNAAPTVTVLTNAC